MERDWLKQDMKERTATRLLEGAFSDIIVSVRHMEVSCSESPFVLMDIHFSGMCANTCENCHSKELWTTVEKDYKPLSSIMMEVIKHFEDAELIDGLCIMGTDNQDKSEAVKILVELAKDFGMISIVFTGYDSLFKATECYGRPTYFIVGPYRKGEWQENKRFFKQDIDNRNLTYTEMSAQEYFSQR